MKPSKLIRLLQGVLVPCLVLGLWHWISASGLVNPMILPSPMAVARKWLEYLSPHEPFDPAKSGYLAWLVSGELLHDAYASLHRVVSGFLIGAGLAPPKRVFAHGWWTVEGKK